MKGSDDVGMGVAESLISDNEERRKKKKKATLKRMIRSETV